MNPLVRENLNASDRNLTIATDLLQHRPQGLDAPAYEWVVVVCFYSAVRCINAYLASQRDALPRTHSQRSLAIKQVAELSPVEFAYTQLENWSRDARYVLAHVEFDQHMARIALDAAQTIRDHIRSLIPADS